MIRTPMRWGQTHTHALSFSLIHTIHMYSLSYPFSTQLPYIMSYSAPTSLKIIGKQRHTCRCARLLQTRPCASGTCGRPNRCPTLYAKWVLKNTADTTCFTFLWSTVLNACILCVMCMLYVRSQVTTKKRRWWRRRVENENRNTIKRKERDKKVYASFSSKHLHCYYCHLQKKDKIRRASTMLSRSIRWTQPR